jgi:cellulose synthase (UDP-forming)
MFYEHIQAGKNANNAAISCGSGVFYRRSSLETIGGFQTWNIVEDLYTSYIFHSKSFKGIYINKPYTIGIAPRFLRTVYKQRGTWALDTLRIFFRKSPLFYPGLTFRQRLHYIEIGWAYIVSAVAIPTLILVPIVSLFTHKAVLSNEGQYFVFRIPSLIAIVYYYYILNDRSFETGRYWAALWPAYLKALFVSLIPHRKKYSVTRKNEFEIQNGIFFVIPHIVLITLMFVALMWRAYQDGGITLFTVVNCVWFALITFWFLPVIRRGIFGKSGKQDREVPEQLAPVYSGVQPTSFSLENSAARFWAGRYAAK